MFSKTIKSFICAGLIVAALPQIASASYHDNYFYKNKGRNKVAVTTKSGVKVTTKMGGMVTARMAYSRCNAPKMSDPYYIFFANDSAMLDDEAKMALKKALEAAMMDKAMKFKLSGHASVVGNAKYNMRLSAKRVAAVEKELTKMGVDAEKVMTAAFGENVPFNRETRTPNARMDRRVELRYVYKK